MLATLYKIQKTLVDIRKFGQTLIEKKKGAFQKIGFWLKRLVSSYTSDSSSNYLFRTYGLASSNGVLYTGRYSYNLSSQVGSLDFKYIKGILH